jgi:hypothetical protein
MPHPCEAMLRDHNSPSLTRIRFKYSKPTPFPKVSVFSAARQAPDKVIDGSKQADLLNQAWTQTWELDGVSSALSIDWKGVKWGTLHPTPQGQDLSGGVVFLNNDWRGIDFTGADLDGIEFFGECKVDQTTKLPPSATVKCANT